MSKQGYDDTTEGFNQACPEHEHGVLAKLTRLPRDLVVLESRRQASSQPNSRETVLSITVETMWNTRKQWETCSRRERASQMVLLTF
jgi:hypothetical protein